MNCTIDTIFRTIIGSGERPRTSKEMYLKILGHHAGIPLVVAFSLFHAVLPEFLLLVGIESRGTVPQDVIWLGIMRAWEASPPYQIFLFGMLFGMVDVALMFGLLRRRAWVPSLVRFLFPVLAIVSLFSMGWALAIMYWLESQVRLEYGLPQFFFIGELLYGTELRIAFFWGLISVIFTSTMLSYTRAAKRRL